MSAYEEIRERTHELERAFYALLDSCDSYVRTAGKLLEEQEALPEPNPQLVNRLRNLSRNVERISKILEDDALTLLLPVLDRLFAVERAERGVDI